MVDHSSESSQNKPTSLHKQATSIDSLSSTNYMLKMRSIQLFFIVLSVLLRNTTSFSSPSRPASLQHFPSGLHTSHYYTTTNHRTNNNHHNIIIRKMAESNDEENTNESVPEGEETSSTPPSADMAPPPPQMRQPPAAPRKRIDPLLASLTRSDPNAIDPNAPTKQIPLLGEVTLDKNFFVLAPIAAFAILGLFSFLLVAINSTDEVVDALNKYNEAISQPPAQQAYDPNVCRGLCSSQEQDLEGLKTFMSNLGGGGNK